MKVKVIGSSSLGNCYLLENDTECLVIEAGVNFNDVKKALNFNISKIIGCVYSHSHQDHSKYLKDFLKVGIPCYSSIEAFQEMKLSGHNCYAMKESNRYKIGNFSVIPFALEHDVKCFGYIVQHSDFGRLIFITDTFQVPYNFPFSFDYLLIEANYDEEILLGRAFYGESNMTLNNRILGKHLSIGKCID